MSDVMIVINERAGVGLYEASDAMQPERGVIGVGTSPDEAIGAMVRQLYLEEDEVTVIDISSNCDEEAGEDE